MTGDKSKSFYGSVKVGERRQIVIPKKARDEYDIKAGDSLIVYGDDKKGHKNHESRYDERFCS